MYVEKKSVEDIPELFNQVKSQMEKGLTKEKACIKLVVNRSWFTRNLSQEQIRELDQISIKNRNDPNNKSYKTSRRKLNIKN